MFAEIDWILFPTECQVLEIVPGTRYVYPIFKNGSRSLFGENFRLISQQEIENLSVIDIFVRDPHERFLSGVQTYIVKSPPWADTRTLLYMVERYLYLNRHFCPQIYWLLNLSRFTRAKFYLRPMDELDQIVGHKLNNNPVTEIVQEYFKDKPKVRFFNEMDEVLTKNLIGQTCTMDDVIRTLKTHYATLYDDAFGTARTLIDVLP